MTLPIGFGRPLAGGSGGFHWLAEWNEDGVLTQVQYGCRGFRVDPEGTITGTRGEPLAQVVQESAPTLAFPGETLGCDKPRSDRHWVAFLCGMVAALRALPRARVEGDVVRCSGRDGLEGFAFHVEPGGRVYDADLYYLDPSRSYSPGVAETEDRAWRYGVASVELAFSAALTAAQAVPEPIPETRDEGLGRRIEFLARRVASLEDGWRDAAGANLSDRVARLERLLRDLGGALRR